MKFRKENYILELDDRQGNILSLLDCRGKEYIGKRNPLARFALLDKDGNRRILTTDAALTHAEGGEEITLAFTGVGGENFSCTAKVRLGDSLTFWRLNVCNGTGDLLEWIDFPCVSVPADLRDNGGNFRLFSSMMEGVEISDATLREKTDPAALQAYPPRGWEGIYPGAAPMQFMAYYDGIRGLYFASHDPSGNYKFVEWAREGNSLRLSQQMYPQCGRAGEYSYDYDVVLGVFEGDWYGAAEIYRDWLYGAGVLTLPPLSENADIPDWIKASPVVVTYPVRGEKDHGAMPDNPAFFPYGNALPVLDGYAREWDSSLLVLLMHWESTAPWAPPYSWPPYGGEEMLRSFSDALHARGHRLGLYCSGLGWTQRSGILSDYSREEQFREEDIGRIVEVGPSHKLAFTPICGMPIREGYDMCPACEKTKQIAESELLKMAEGTGADYIQFFDQNLGGNTYACYSEEHGHPPAPGKWMAEEMRALVRRMKEKLRAEGSGAVLGCEAAACEPLVNDLFFNDLRYNINYKFGTPVPAYNFIFHGYVCNFMGNHNCSSMLVDLHRYPDYVYYRYAYSFLQGDVLTVVLKGGGKMNWEWDLPWDDDCEPDQEELSRFIRALNGARRQYAEFLVYGRAERPLPVKCAEEVQELSVGALQHMNSVLTARYSAGDRSCQFFVNWTGSEQPAECGGKTLLLKPKEIKAVLI